MGVELREKDILWWEIFVKPVGIKAGVKSEGDMDDKSGEPTKKDDVPGARRGESKRQG